MKYCTECGSDLSYRVPEGDDRPRFVCTKCGLVHYENPKIVVGCIAIWDNRILFCKRAIEPCYGKWTLPAGFLENGETVEEGTIREALEEAGAKIDGLEAYALYNLPYINQVYLIFRSRIVDTHFKVGDESLEVKLFKEDEIPWNELAFPVIRMTLRSYFNDMSKGSFPFHIGDVGVKTLDE